MDFASILATCQASSTSVLAVWKRLKGRFATVRSYAQFVLTNALPRISKPGVVLYLDQRFPDIHDRRYFYLLLQTLLDAEYGVEVVWKIRFQDYRRLYLTYEGSIVKLRGLKFVSKCPKASKSKMLFTNVATSLSDNGWKKVIEVDCDISTPRRSDQELSMPYFMHPEQYKREGRTQIAEMRTRSRPVRAYFSGNVNEEFYSNPLPGNKLTRSEIVQALKVMPGVKFLSDEKDFRELLSRGGHDVCAIVDRRSFAVSDDGWLEALARSDFFLCLPGSRMPMCHNTIEAMAVGTIPILNYGEWFDPPLKHRETCIQFNTLQELRDRVAEVLSLDSNSVQAMREKVITYYEEHLSPMGFRQKLEESRYDRITLRVNTAYPWETKPEILALSQTSLKSHSSGRSQIVPA